MTDHIVDLIPVKTVLTMILSYKHNLFRYNLRNMFSGLRLIQRLAMRGQLCSFHQILNVQCGVR